MSRMTAPRIRPGGRRRGATWVNIAGGCGTAWSGLGGPGSVLLTLFLQEWLHAEKWQIGLVVTMNFLGPVLEPVGACWEEHVAERRPLFLRAFLLARIPFLLFALLPFISSAEHGRPLGILTVLAVVGLTRVPTHLGNPAWWSWIADLVPARRHGRFFGCRSQIAGAAAALSFVAAAVLLQVCGGMQSARVLSGLFFAGALFGIVDILLHLQVPDVTPRRAVNAARNEMTGLFVRVKRQTHRLGAMISDAFRTPAYRRFILGMGLWSLSANLMLPFLPVYQRGEVLEGRFSGLGISWLALAVVIAVGNFAAMLTGRFWASLCERIGPRPVQLIGSGYLFVYLVYLPLGGTGGLLPLALVGAVSGALNSAWTVAASQLLLGLAPKSVRSYYVSACNATSGVLMAGGPLLGGWLADRLPLLGRELPGGLPCCYFHVLIVAAAVGGAASLLILFGWCNQEPAVARTVPARLRTVMDLRRLQALRLKMTDENFATVERRANGRHRDDSLPRKRAARCAGTGAGGRSSR